MPTRGEAHNSYLGEGQEATVRCVRLPYTVYENSIAGKRLVEEGLRKHIKAILTDLRIPVGPGSAASG